ncbi:MAG: DUF1501 domain-containing protein [Phycisphaera sp.]|nr:DUF1501 domain-containing protein [Phycisphaera sp.]
MPLTRRHLLRHSACGFGSLALAGLLGEQQAHGASSQLAPNPLAPRPPHFAPKAKRVIFLYMSGGPSQMDTFDYKPLLQRDHGKPLPGGVPELQKAAGRRLGTLLGSPFKWAQHGQSGLHISELFPNVAHHADDLCVIKSMHTEGFDHANATLKFNTGAITSARPSMGSWITYGLGTDNASLPGFLTICPDRTRGTRNYSNAFLPAIYQGTAIGHDGTPTREADIRHLTNAELSPDLQREQLAFIQSLNRDHQQRASAGGQLEGLIQSFELAFRMQAEAPKWMGLESEPTHVLDSYGIGDDETDDFGRQCLMARRFAEAGVRFIQLTHTIRRRHNKIAQWDQHQYLEEGLRLNSNAVDKPIAALLADLKQRGLFDDTLVLWGGEFGRTSVLEMRGKDSTQWGRDHNPLGFTVWMAGGGVKGGYSHGATDDYGYRAVDNKVHIHDLHATILHLLGLDHERLTYRYAGRDFRLTDVYGNVVHDIIA